MFEEIPEGYELCSYCKGRGCFPLTEEYVAFCPICEGKGTVDWITKVMKDDDHYNWIITKDFKK